MIEQGWRSQNALRVAEPSRAEPSQVKRLNLSGARGHWVDAMLGAGSRKVVEKAFAGARAQGPAAGRPLQMRAQGSEEEGTPLPRKRKGVIRLLAALAALGWVAAQTRPWEGIRFVKATVPAPEAPAAQPSPKATVADAGGKALALWQGRDGQWYGVNKKGGLTRMGREDALARLDLPHLSAAAVAGEEKGGKVELSLKMPEGMLEELLPLEESLATEVESLSVGEGGARLRTHSGILAELGLGGYKAKQARLAAVLSDLAARRKRAALVDMRYEGTAVVKLN